MDSSLSLKTDSFELTVAIDSSDVLYRLNLEAFEDSYAKAGEALQAAASGQRISNILKMGSRDFSEDGLCFERILYALKLLIKRFQGSDVYKVQTSDAHPGELICRCNFLDRNQLQKAFLEAKGDFKKALLETNASMICSSCSVDVKAVYDSMTFEELEKAYERIKVAVQESLKEFSLVCPPDYDQLVLSVANVKNETIKIKAEGERKGLGRQQIKKTLQNFLSKEATEGLEISVFF